MGTPRAPRLGTPREPLCVISAVAKMNDVLEHVEYHKDESVRATGTKVAGELHGSWEWFRKDGSRMRSGHFDRGVKVGEWTTHDTNGDVYKVTNIKTKHAPQ